MERRLNYKKLLVHKVFFDGFQHHFWCAKCHKWHSHGRGEGFRTPHCPLSASTIDSYEIKQYNKKELRQILKWTEFMLGKVAA